MNPISIKKPIRTYVNPRKVVAQPAAKRKIDPDDNLLKREQLTTKKAIELLLSGKLKGNVCRYCLNIAFPLSELDQILRVGGRGAVFNVTIRDMVASFHPFKVTEDPNLPSKICESCLNQAIRSYLFAQQCEQSERAIRNCFDDIFDKVQKLDPSEPSKKRGRQKLHPNHNVIHTEHRKVIDFADPIVNLINSGSVSFTKESPMTNLECKKCWQVLPNVDSLVNHQKIHPKTMWYHCRVCGRAFVKLYHLKKHLGAHKKDKKMVLPVNDKFECKQCYHVSENHLLHFQHIEKHKFQMVLEHLVERKMDELCTVCLDKGKLEDIDKIVCLHGGYPELTGNRTLYNILGSTVPEKKSYKYQELLVPCKANVVTITKRCKPITHNDPKPEQTYFISPPIIIATEDIDCDDCYLFLFSEPHELNQRNINLIDEERLDDSNNNEIEHVKAVMDCTEKVLPLVDKVTERDEFTFDKPVIIDEAVNIAENKVTVTVATGYEDSSINKTALCETCWIFKKPMCDKCNKTKDNEEQMLNNAIDNVGNTEDCNYCWIFKKVDKCNYCKKSFKENDATEVEASIKVETKGQTIKRRLVDEKDEVKAKKSKWQCSVCLITNSPNRETCICCASSEISPDKRIKISFGQNRKLFLNSPGTEEKPSFTPQVSNDNLEVINELKEVKITERKSDTLKSGEEITKPKPILSRIEDTKEMKDSSEIAIDDNIVCELETPRTTESESNKMDSNNMQLNSEMPSIQNTIKEQETMDFEDVIINQTIAKPSFNPFPDITFNIPTATKTSSFNNPFSNITFNSPTAAGTQTFQSPVLQFNLGSRDKRHDTRKQKRSFNKMSKSFHK